MIRVGVVGLGNWGTKLVRCFSEVECDLMAICDERTDPLFHLTDLFPWLYPMHDFDALLDQKLVDALAIATPQESHYQLAKKAIQRGLHVFMDDPLTHNRQHFQELYLLARARNRVLHVCQPTLHSPLVQRCRRIVRQKELGDVRYVASRRLNLASKVQRLDPIADLAPHDVSMIMYLFDSQPTAVTCSGLDPWTSGVPDVCNLVMQFPGRRLGMVNISCLDPRSEHTLTVAGAKKTAVYDELAPDKLKIYDTDAEASHDYGDFVVSDLSNRRSAESSPFKISFERLRVECADFVRSIEQGSRPRIPQNGFQLIQVLDSAKQSLREGGKSVAVPTAIQEVADPRNYRSYFRDHPDENRRF